MRFIPRCVNWPDVDNRLPGFVRKATPCQARQPKNNQNNSNDSIHNEFSAFRLQSAHHFSWYPVWALFCLRSAPRHP
jgi:hypothetical protein